MKFLRRPSSSDEGWGPRRGEHIFFVCNVSRSYHGVVMGRGKLTCHTLATFLPHRFEFQFDRVRSTLMRTQSESLEEITSLSA